MKISLTAAIIFTQYFAEIVTYVWKYYMKNRANDFSNFQSIILIKFLINIVVESEINLGTILLL